ncbi:MAG: biopolymer transporter ExbD [Vicinamibacteria bacterium]
MSMSVGEKKGSAIADINVTPMADIMIVLLIIFMVITPLINKGIDVELPQASNTKERKDDPKNITIGFTKKFEVFFNGAPVAGGITELKERLVKTLEERSDGDKVAFLKADIGIEYGEVMKVMNACREAGIEEIALISDPKVEG